MLPAVLGRYADITAKDYLDVQVTHTHTHTHTHTNTHTCTHNTDEWVCLQVDNEARKVWDTYVVKLDTVDRDPNTGSEIVHWILKYPVSMHMCAYIHM